MSSRSSVVCIALFLLLQTDACAGTRVPRTNDAPASNAPGADKYGDPLPPYAIARLGTARLRHSAAVNSLAFSPDGKTLASAGDDRLAILWDVASGKELRVLAHPHPVRSVLFTPDGETLLTASNHPGDSRLHFWDLPSGKEGRSLELPGGNELARMILSRDGKTLFTCSMKGPMVSWDLAWRKELWRVQPDDDWCKCLALSPDGKTLATGSRMEEVCFRNAGTGRLEESLLRYGGGAGFGFPEILSLAYAPDGRTITFAVAKEGLRWQDLAGNRSWRMRAPADVSAALAFTPDGRKLACGVGPNLCLFDPASRTEVARVEGHVDWICSIAFSPDGRCLASAGQDGSVRVWDAATLKPLFPLADEPGGTCFVSFRQRGSQLLLTNSSRRARDRGIQSNDEVICLRRARDARSAAAMLGSPWQSYPGGPGCLSPDGKVFALEGEKGRVRLTDTLSGKKFRTVGKEGENFLARAADFSPDGGVVAVVSNEPGAADAPAERVERLRLWDVATGKLVGALIEEMEISTIENVRFSSRGGLLVADHRGADSGHAIRLWHLGKGQPPRRVKTPELPDEYQPALSPDGWLLITRPGVKGDEGDEPKPSTRAIRVREIVSGKVILSLEERDVIGCAAPSPDSRILAVGGSNGIRLLELASGKELGWLPGHRGGVASLEFSADGSLLVSGGEDSTALVWDFRACLAEATKASRPGEALWSGLAAADAARAFRAMQALVGNPEEGVAFLKRHLRPASQPDPAAVRALIVELDADRFEARERTTDRLHALEVPAVPLLEIALKTTASAEVRRRLERLLADADDPRNSPERLRDLRAVHCLATVGTGPARQLLQTLAEGAPEALLTQQAREELEWLARR